ncbi:polysaccharide deacetylase family protein [Shimia sp. MMG029]|uniref:polysaccharide deacetylase family protein n=1 Tax=Shimia sp. MMG029 TaxID=3021978 RepID=UPI0022FE7740|nr:polysaccharide deacetylase family protein [Shimia sp. MMG029]MDA5557539.1 polysaccharide deacetylase family protein [Shimia sp. MMG029]
MKADWQPLRAEFRTWRSEGLTLPFWWRDDDAVVPTPKLDQLSALSAATEVPVHLAIIPKQATQALADVLDARFVPIVHGWDHVSHSLPGAKNAEFGAGRQLEAVEDDLRNACGRMQRLFGSRLAPMFVPPWNRMDTAFMPTLAELGYDAVSAYNPRKQAFAAASVAQINTHLDPIFWRGTRGLVEPEVLITQMVALLKDRRAGVTDNHEPLGYLTHHLVHDADIWEFSREFLKEICDGPVQLYRHDQRGEL